MTRARNVERESPYNGNRRPELSGYPRPRVDSEVGPLAIGNFNETMQSSGLDRQFRGEIRALRVFGSRVGGRGALKPEEINAHLRE